jgi:hypothetical protein
VGARRRRRGRAGGRPPAPVRPPAARSGPPDARRRPRTAGNRRRNRPRGAVPGPGPGPVPTGGAAVTPRPQEAGGDPPAAGARGGGARRLPVRDAAAFGCAAPHPAPHDPAAAAGRPGVPPWRGRPARGVPLLRAVGRAAGPPALAREHAPEAGDKRRRPLTEAGSRARRSLGHRRGRRRGSTPRRDDAQSCPWRPTAHRSRPDHMHLATI